ncbi:hypothetical protein [Sphingomonas sp. 1P08PE]|uniref:hypothetical protein n=1 Tax=Sphingomonas sp. 1P08PE TaxID=554122 RepID=UPI0039A2609A
MKELTPGGVGIWVLVFGFFGAMVKAWPALKKLANEREAGALAARAEDMEDMRKRISDLEAKVETASTAAHSAELKLVYAVSAVQLLAAKIRADNPNDPALLQAMELLKAATSGEMPPWAGKVASGINNIRGTGE